MVNSILSRAHPIAQINERPFDPPSCACLLPISAQLLQALRIAIQQVQVDLQILRANEPNLPVLLASLSAGLLIKSREWVIACLAALLSLPQNFVGLASLLKQSAVTSSNADAVWANLLAAWQGDSPFDAYAEHFRTLADLAGAPKNVLPRLF